MAVLKKQPDRVMYPGWLINYLKREGISKETMTEAAGLSVDRFTDGREVMPLDNYLQLFSWAGEYFNEPHIGLVLAQQATPDDFGLFGFLTSSTETLGDMCQLFDRYQRILMQGASMEFIREGEQIEARYRITSSIKDGVVQDVEFSLAVLIRIVQEALDTDWLPERTSFEHSRFGPEEDYRHFFGQTLSFDQTRNAIWFSVDLWDLPLPTANSMLFSVLADQANRLLKEIEDSADFLGQVRFLVSSRLGAEDFSIESLAQELNMSSRTLHRRLRQENTTFKDVKLELMLEVAKDALLNEEVSIADLAQTLGYSESSAFVRVFKRLQGVSPLQFRKQNLG